MGFAAHCDHFFSQVPDCRAVSRTQHKDVPTMRPSVSVERSLISLRSFHPQPAATARALSPLPDQLSLADAPAAEAILTPAHNTAAPPGAGRFASVDENTNQRLSAVKTAPPQAGDRGADQAQL